MKDGAKPPHAPTTLPGGRQPSPFRHRGRTAQDSHRLRPDSGWSASAARTAAAGLAVQRRCNGYAVPAGWVIPCVVLVAAAQGAPTLGSLPYERPGDGFRSGGGTRGDRSDSRGREGGSVERSAAALE